MLSTNIHRYERWARVIIGAVALSLAFVGPSNLWLLLGVIPLVTGVVGWCPPYQILGINTATACPTRTAERGGPSTGLP